MMQQLSQSQSVRYCVLEYPLFLEDMIGLVPYPGVLLIGYRPTFMYPVRPFKTYYSVSSGPRYLGI